jgi:hypothetical protein
MSFALGQEESLDGDSAERGEVDQVGVLDAVSEAPLAAMVSSSVERPIERRSISELTAELLLIPL